jgi:hypothetical protein
LLKKLPQPTKKKSLLSPKQHSKKATINPEDLSISNLSEVQPSQHRPTPMPMTARDPGSYFQPEQHDPQVQRKQRLHWTLKLAEKIRNENELQVKLSQAQQDFLREQELTPPKPETLKVMAFSESRGPHVSIARKVMMRQPSSETVMSSLTTTNDCHRASTVFFYDHGGSALNYQPTLQDQEELEAPPIPTGHSALRFAW